MLSIRTVREQPELVRDNIRKKFQDDKLELVDRLLDEDKLYRERLQEIEQLRARRNALSKSVSERKKQGQDAQDLLAEAKEIPAKIKEIEGENSKRKEQIDRMLYAMPNILHDSVRQGKDDSENVEVRRIGEIPERTFETKSHTDIIEQLGLGDFDASARVAGNGFYYLIGDLALLNQALIQYAVQFMHGKGYTMIEPPLMTTFDVLSGTTPLKEIEDQAYKIDNEDLYLIATSEFPLIGMFINQVIDHTKLPIRLCGFSPCFRKEIGSHGIDEKGLFRTHQFNKVEQIIICDPKDSWKYYDELLQNSIELFEALGLPARVLEMCSGDTSDLKMKQADLEVYSLRKKDFIEVCSCSNLGDNQSQLLNIKIRHHEGNYFPHTLNDTAIATSRALVAILEHYQQEDGSVMIPEVLRPLMGGREKLAPTPNFFV